MKSRTVEKTKEETTMAEIYKNIKTGAKAELIEINEKSKQVTLKKLADGKPTSTLMGSFEKYWKKIDGDAITEKKPAKTETKKVEKPVEEPVKEVKKEEPKAEKPKKEKAEKPKKEKKSGKSEEDRVIIRDSLVKALADNHISAIVSTKYPMWIDVKIGEKNAFGIGMNAASIRVRSIKELMPSGIEFHEVKGGFSAGLTFTYDKVSDLQKLIINTNKNFKDSDILKRKRKEKSEKSEKKETKKSKKVETEEK